MKRVAVATALAAAALALAGCGSSKSSSSGGGSIPDGASKAPASAPAFVALDTSQSSWDDVLKIARKFPLFTSSVKQSDVDKLRAAAGPELDFVWTDFDNGGDDVVALTKPSTLAKLKAAVSGAVYANLSDGWVAFASNRARLDRFTNAGGAKLDGDKDFKDAFGGLDSHAAVRSWVRGSVVQSALDSSLASSGAAPRITHDVGDLRFLAGAADAKGDGASFDFDARLDRSSKPATFKPSLPSDVPAGALLYVGMTKLDDPTRIILKLVGESQPNFETQLKQVESVLGVSLNDDVYPLLEGESALVVYSGGGSVPPILFLQKVSDESKADRLLRRFTALAQLSGVSTTSVQVEGKTAEKLRFSGGTTIYDGVAGGKVFVTNALDLAQAAVAGPSSSLADAGLYRSAKSAAGVPDNVAAFAYGDLEHGLPFAFDLAERSGSTVPASARTNTKPLQSAFAYLVPDGDNLRLSGFTTIK